MENNITLWFHLGQYSHDPSCFSTNLQDFINYLDHLKSIGHNMYSYEEIKKRGFIQMITLSNETWNNIKNQKDYCIFTEPNENRTQPCKIMVLEDTIKAYAKALSIYWNQKVTVKGLARMHNPKCNLFFNEKFNIYESM